MRRGSGTTVTWGSGAALLIGGIFLLTAHGADLDLEQLPPIWFRTTSVETGVGYKDNVLLSSGAPQASAFIATGLDYYLVRPPLDGWQYQFLLTGNDRRFLSANAVDGEQLVIAQAQAKKDWSPAWQATLPVEFLYQNQVLDVSPTESDLHIVRAQAQIVQTRPAVRRTIASRVWLELSFPVGRYLYHRPLDDYWEGGSKLTFGQSYGRKSEWTLSYAYGDRRYDTRLTTTADGVPLADTHLEFQSHRVELAWRHNWDQARRWRTTTRLTGGWNRDNGNGFFDYRQLVASEQVRYTGRSWELSADVRFSHYAYPIQTLSLTDPTKLGRWEATATLRCERRLADWLKLFAEYEHTRVESRASFEEYSVNTVTSGVIWEF